MDQGSFLFPKSEPLRITLGVRVQPNRSRQFLADIPYSS